MEPCALDSASMDACSTTVRWRIYYHVHTALRGSRDTTRHDLDGYHRHRLSPDSGHVNSTEMAAWSLLVPSWKRRKSTH